MKDKENYFTNGNDKGGMTTKDTVESGIDLFTTENEMRGKTGNIGVNSLLELIVCYQD